MLCVLKNRRVVQRTDNSLASYRWRGSAHRSHNTWLLGKPKCCAAQDITTAFAMFDADESGYIDKDEFETLFETLRASRPGAAASAGRTGFHAGPACAAGRPRH